MDINSNKTKQNEAQPNPIIQHFGFLSSELFVGLWKKQAQLEGRKEA